MSQAFLSIQLRDPLISRTDVTLQTCLTEKNGAPRPKCSSFHFTFLHGFPEIEKFKDPLSNYHQANQGNFSIISEEKTILTVPHLKLN